MRKLLLSQGKYLLHQSKLSTKNRLDQLKILKNINAIEKDPNPQPTNLLHAKTTIGSNLKHNNTSEQLKIQRHIDSSLKSVWRCFSQLDLTKPFLKNDQRISNYIHETPKDNKDQQQFKFSRSRLIRHMLLILFFAELLQHQNILCDYDINDMMVTIELEDELLVEEEEKRKFQQDDEKRNKIKKEQQQKSETIQKENYERYGTVEQMLKQQMDNSEDFGSIEQRMMIKQSQKIKNKKNKNNISQKQVLASNIQKSNAQLETDITTHDLKNQKIKEQQNAISINESIHENKSQRTSSNQQTINQKTLQLNTEIVNTQIENEANPVTQVTQKKQNYGTIQFTSQEFLPLAKRIQNFLGLRGIKVTVSSLKRDQSQQNLQPQNGIQLNLCNKIMDCKEIRVKKQSDDRDVFHHINNFLNPPHIINSIEQAKSLLRIIQKDENIIGTYIPEKSPSQNEPRSPFDTFSSRYPIADPSNAEKQFREYKYLSSSKKNCFAIIRDKLAAEYLKVSTIKIGVPHVLYKYDKQLNGKQSEPNCQIDGDFYHVVQNFDKLIQKQGLNTTDKVSQKINQLTERGFTLINSAEDMFDKIRQVKQQALGFSFQEESQAKPSSPMKKLFTIKLNDPKSQKQINGILEKLSRMNSKQVSIIKTQSELLLKSLGIFSNEQYGTIRLIDLQQRQQPVVKQILGSQLSAQFLRYLPKVPFQIEFLSKWVSNISPYDKPHEEQDHSVNKLRASHPGDFESVQQVGKMKLVLFYKEGCKGCKLMQDLMSKLVELKQKLKQGDDESAKRIRREICLRYRIEDSQHIRGIDISKFNILNDDKSIQVPQTTPTIYLFDGRNRQKAILKTDQIFSHLNRINTNNGEIVQDYMIRELIDEIEKGCRRFQLLG